MVKGRQDNFCRLILKCADWPVVTHIQYIDIEGSNDQLSVQRIHVLLEWNRRSEDKRKHTHIKREKCTVANYMTMSILPLLMGNYITLRMYRIIKLETFIEFFSFFFLLLLYFLCMLSISNENDYGAWGDSYSKREKKKITTVYMA